MPSFGLEITPRPDLPAIVARWQREITVAELQAGYLAVLAAADALGCWRWLLDLRRRNELATAELTTWVNNNFFPQLARRYAAPVRLAFLVSPLRAAQAQTDSSVAFLSTNAHPTQSYLTALFIDEAAAYQWLAG